MNKEKITYKIPNNQIHISEIKDEDCLIWISPKALYMANTIDKLQQERDLYKEVIEEIRKYIEDWLFDAGGNGASMTYEDINELLQILDKIIGDDK